MSNAPLVSVIVITYNSAKYVVETLDSIFNQSYQPIELIIADDKSSDTTIEICEDWVERNRERFVNVQIINPESNGGIPANCNRGLKAANGEWIKFIAGDDILMPHAVHDYMQFASAHHDCELIHSPVIRLIEHEDGSTELQEDEIINNLNESINSDAQFKLLNFSSMVKAPSVIIHKNIFETVGVFDESIPRCEDWPFWLKVTHAGKRFFYLKKPLVYYRIHSASVYSSMEGKYIVSPFYDTEKIIYDKYIDGHAGKLDRLFLNYNYALKNFFLKKNNSSNSRFYKKMFAVLNVPFRIYQKIVFSSILK